MGAGSSKPEDVSKHVFASDTPVSFSQELIESLQASNETDSSRAKTLELHIAQRVASELEKLQKRETEALESLRGKLTAEEEKPPSLPPQQSAPAEAPTGGSLLELDTNKDTLTSVNPLASSQPTKPQPTSSSVRAEIEKLRQALSQRKVLKDLPADVNTAREAVVQCLRANDRRPLDCWKEVEGFKRAVRAMEEEFVGGVL